MNEHRPARLEGEYVPSSSTWVANQVAAYRATGGAEGDTVLVGGVEYPCVLYTARGRRSGALRTFPLIRVEHDGRYCLIASNGGADDHPAWYRNLTADPTIEVQDGPEPFVTTVRELTGDERDTWWARAVEVFPQYATYAAGTDRLIPVLVTD